MKIEEAIDYCEKHECIECPIYTKQLDTRTRDEWMDGVLCCKNLCRYDLVNGVVMLNETGIHKK